MDINLNFLFFIFIIICFIGFFLAYLYGRNTIRFYWREYIAIIFLPILCVVYLVIFIDWRILNLFLLSALVGFMLEYIIGLTYHKTLNRRLWKYKRLSVGGYTSLLTLPIWGVAGIIFWMLAKTLNL